MFSVSPSTYISTSEEVPLEIRGWCRIHKDVSVDYRLAPEYPIPTNVYEVFKGKRSRWFLPNDSGQGPEQVVKRLS
ncbi:hypothetical protein Tco_0533305 [Tanacetum coccineum]